VEIFAQKLEIDFIGNSKKFKYAQAKSVKRGKISTPQAAWEAKQSSEITLGVFLFPHPADLCTNITDCNYL